MQRLSSQEEDLAAGLFQDPQDGTRVLLSTGYERDRARRSGLRQLETKLSDAGAQCPPLHHTKPLRLY